MAKPVKILSIDGGGIRGIIPAVVLAGIEQRTGRRIAEMFDLIAGTSTGGILALALTKPDAGGKPQYAAEDLVRLYEQEGRRIFHRSAWHTVASLAALAEEKFRSAGIEGVLEEYFGEARLKDATTGVIITSYEIEHRFPFFFKSQNAKTKPGYDFAMKHVARATSAAPTFFEPCKLEAGGAEDYYALIDGGVYANNPAMCGLVEAMTCCPQATEFLVVSLGTGEQLNRLPYDKAKGWGLAHWAKPVLEIVFDGVSSTVDYQLRQILPSTHYFRFQTRLPQGSGGMDDTSPDNLRGLKLQGEALVRERE
ncbi:MAG: patatin-like phospholipase family protein, partial [Acidobacteriales bacterium]|nr:patatin-like phospholipase family protein [Terriglobales bacterium]